MEQPAEYPLRRLRRSLSAGAAPRPVPRRGTAAAHGRRLPPWRCRPGDGCGEIAARCDAGQITQITEYLDHLGGVAERRIVERHVAHPQRAKTEPVGQAGQRGVALHVGFAGQARTIATGLLAGGRPVVIERQFDADAKAAFGKFVDSRLHNKLHWCA
jgi:hypothetical protein